MQLTKRGKKGVWWFRFTAPNGNRVFRSSKTTDKKLAQEYADKIKFQYWRKERLGEKPPKLWSEASKRYLNERKKRRTYENIKLYLSFLDKNLSTRYLSDIDSDVIADLVSKLMSRNIQNASVNRYIETLRAVLRCAKNEWEWIDALPRIKLLEEPKHRIRWLTKDEASRLLTALPSHVRAMAHFTLVTGLRESNVTGLEWSQISLERKILWIHPDQFKTGEPKSIPLNDEALKILADERGKNDKFVFTRAGRPIKKAGASAFKKALKKVGIQNFRWHDLRHTWASWHIQSGTPLPVLQELGGWSSYEIVLRYAHLGESNLIEYASNVSCAEK